MTLSVCLRHARWPQSPAAALPCESPARPGACAPPAAGPGSGPDPYTSACGLLSPGDAPSPSPRSRGGARAASYARPSYPDPGRDPERGASAWAVGAALGGEGAALPASLAGETLHCNPVFAGALRGSQQARAAGSCPPPHSPFSSMRPSVFELHVRTGGGHLECRCTRMHLHARADATGGALTVRM